MSSNEDTTRRFTGIGHLYGADALDNFQRAHVCVIGIGGVGSWAAEALARSAIGQLTLIDMDHIAESNINRQLHALSETLGRAKIEVIAERVRGINPGCRLNLIDDFVTADNLSAHLDHPYDYVIDCIDGARNKAAIIAWCRRNKIKIITAGAAGGLMEPTQIQIADLNRTYHDALLAKTRKLLRQDYDFPANEKRRFQVAAVFSSEQVRRREDECSTASEGESFSALNCANGLGSVTPVTAGFGFAAVAHVLGHLSQIPAPSP